MFGDWHLAMASYNGGPGRVQRAMKRSRKDDFWKLTLDHAIPAARDPRLRADDPGRDHHRQEPRAVRLRHRCRTPPTPTENVTLPAAVDLRRVAEWAGVPVDEIQKLNPEFRRWTTPVREGSYTLARARRARPTALRDGVCRPRPPAS